MSHSSEPDVTSPEVIIIGGGLAGLTCANALTQAGKSVAVLEATDRVGGRVRSDVVDGFVLDHGFQVLLTAYPACRQWLDYDALKLRSFQPGALVRVAGRFATLADPWRRPAAAIQTALSPVGSLGDKLRIAKLRRESRRGDLETIYQRPGVSTLQRLQAGGFSETMIDRFFRPFLGGVFLDESLETSSRMLEFVFRMFAEGDVAVPAEGMGAIPRQLAEKLPRGSVRLRTTVAAIRDGQVHLTDESVMNASHIVVATESNAAARLLGLESLTTPWASASTFYYAADLMQEKRPVLMLRGDESGPVQTAVVMSDVAPEYAPTGKSLISVNVGDEFNLDDPADLDVQIRRQLNAWFGGTTERWRLLCRYDVPFGLPKTSLDPVLASVSAADFGGPSNVYLCGDHRETPSIQGAMNSGMRAANAILTR
ncbi:NAD(P)/FAD-dependent oxidoreductase [Stieleria varia]|uniref:NAD(P)/FAD-dependent oxidoreductase n=1 Tax=Stieleria varia TaxID=2528005 RepID=UPI0011B4415F|nr:NAD(P)/FAD-dependent oxidoreductase [Stieleria varia]